MFRPSSPHLTSLAASVFQLYVSHGTQGGARWWPEESLPGRRTVLPGVVAKYCSHLGRGAVPPGPCCCGQLGGGRLRPCLQLSGRGLRRPPGVCACAVRSGSRLLPPSPESRLLSPPRGREPEYSVASRFRPYPDPLTLSLGCIPPVFSRWPS